MPKRNQMFIRSLCFVLLVFCLTSCGKVELQHDLSEEDANEIMVLLSENGIKVTKKKEKRQNEVFSTVLVAADDLSRARSLLLQHRLPRHKELGLSGVYKEKGIIPTPDEQKARYLLALKGEIINSLERIPIVVDADVVLNVPVKDEFASDREERKHPTASVIVQAKPPSFGEEGLSEAKIQQFVANAVEGLNPRDVAVIVSYIHVEGEPLGPGEVLTLPPKPLSPEAAPTEEMQHELLGLALDESSKDRLKMYLLFFFLLLVILSTALILSIVQGSRMRRTLTALKGAPSGQAALEGRGDDENLKLGPPGGEGG